MSRPNSGAYSASKFALVGWSDALYAEQLRHGVHVGLVLPGFVRTEGFPATELLARPQTRWLVSEPERVAEAILEAGPGGKAERYVPGGTGSPPRYACSPRGSSAAPPPAVRLRQRPKASEASLAGD